MNSLNIISTTLILFVSLTAKADDPIGTNSAAKGDKKESVTVPAGRVIYGRPDDPAPENLVMLSNLPVAPMIWGNPEDPAPEELTNRTSLPSLPKISGNPDEAAPEDLLIRASLPVLPKIWENPEDVPAGL